MTDEETLWVGFTGSRDYPKPELVAQFVRNLIRKYPNAGIVSGGRGKVDETAEQTGIELEIDIISYRPHETWIEVVNHHRGTPLSSSSKILGFNNWTKNAFFRNEWIAACPKVVAFWDGRSRGTADTISKARGKESELFVYDVAGNLRTGEEVAESLALVLG